MKPFLPLVATVLLAPGGWCQEPATNPSRTAEPSIRTFLERHCRECHGPEKPKGNFRVDQLDFAFTGKPAEERWQTLMEQLRSGAMPPKKKTRPPAEELQAVTGWIRERTAAAEASRRASQGRVVLRRLNRVEYTNTVCDLLDIRYDFQEILALDGSIDGFDNVGAGLHLSSFALERYLEAAHTALNLTISDRPQPKPIRKRFTLVNQHPVRVYKEKFYRTLEDGTVVCFLGSHDGRVYLSNFSPPGRGLYRFRISASGFQSAGKPVTFDVTSAAAGLVGYFDVPADSPTVIEFVTPIEITRIGPTNIGLLPYGVGNAVAKAPGGATAYDGPGLAVHWVEIEGPILDGWPPASHRRLFGDLPQAPTGKYRERLEVISPDPLPDAERILRMFVRRAFRRAVTGDEVRPFVDVVRERLEEKDSFEQAMRAALSAVMCSPGFLFLNERPGVLDEFALASRLSYFLWSSMPDEELLAAAEAKLLAQPDALRRQVERMLRSPKAAEFTRNFCGQWLGLRDIDFTAPQHLIYPEWDPMLKASMVRETELFFTELLSNDLSLMNIVASDFSILNGRLAKHYGIPGVEGLWEFRKVPLPPGCHRGGVLTMASVLKVTADGTNTSPIRRGAWVLDRILGTPPPKPPADVPPLEPDIRGAKTIREQLAKHRDLPACAGCHAQIDPPGFALESFDVIGGWRTYYRRQQWTRQTKAVQGVLYLQGPDVDATGEMADGRPFRDVDEFKLLLLRDKDQIARSLARKLVTYATGGPPGPSDQAEVEAILARIRPGNHGLRSLVHEIVQSRMFRNK